MTPSFHMLPSPGRFSYARTNVRSHASHRTRTVNRYSVPWNHQDLGLVTRVCIIFSTRCSYDKIFLLLVIRMVPDSLVKPKKTRTCTSSWRVVALYNNYASNFAGADKSGHPWMVSTQENRQRPSCGTGLITQPSRMACLAARSSSCCSDGRRMRLLRRLLAGAGFRRRQSVIVARHWRKSVQSISDAV